MIDYFSLIKFLIALIIYSSIIINLKNIANFFNLYDIPSKLKIHKIKTPLVGIFPIISVYIFFIIINLIDDFNFDFFLIFIISSLFFLVGLIDDIKNLNAYFKLFITSIILIIFLSFSDALKINILYFETLNKNIEFNNSFLNIFFSSLCILLLANALNLSDGINGLASGIATIWVFTLSMLLENSTQIYFIILAIFLGINTYKIYQGKFFLGDSGTLFLGSFIGLLTIYVYGNLSYRGFVIPAEKIFLFFIVPGLDMFRLFLIRISKAKDPFSGDLNHLHHYLISKFSLKITLLIYWGIIIINILIAYTFDKSLYMFIIFYLIFKFSLLVFLKKKSN